MAVDRSTAKVLVIGPCESGKSTICDFIGGVTETLGRDGYEPTVGVRILEFNKGHLPVEMWDVSGDRGFQSGWTAIQKDVTGVVIVYNGEDPEHERNVGRWHEWFVKSQGLDDARCMVMSHTAGLQPSRSTFSPDLKFVKFACTSFEAPAIVRREFESFLDSLKPVVGDGKK